MGLPFWENAGGEEKVGIYIVQLQPVAREGLREYCLPKGVGNDKTNHRVSRDACPRRRPGVERPLFDLSDGSTDGQSCNKRRGRRTVTVSTLTPSARTWLGPSTQRRFHAGGPAGHVALREAVPAAWKQLVAPPWRAAWPLRPPFPEQAEVRVFVNPARRLGSLTSCQAPFYRLRPRSSRKQSLPGGLNSGNLPARHAVMPLSEA